MSSSNEAMDFSIDNPVHNTSAESEHLSLAAKNIPRKLAEYLGNPRSFKMTKYDRANNKNFVSYANKNTSSSVNLEENASNSDQNSCATSSKFIKTHMAATPDYNTMSCEEFLDYQLKLVKLEREAELERENSKTLTIEGEGIPGVLPHLEVVGVSSTKFRKYCVTFASYTGNKLPPHALRKGDNISIYAGSALCRDEDFCIDGVVLTVNLEDVRVAIDESYIFTNETWYAIKHHPSLENSERLLDGVNELKNVTGVANGLVGVLFRESEPMPPLPMFPKKICCFNSDELNLYNKNLNKSQQSAVEFLIKQQDLGVLHGPPGTGKTTVLIELIRLHVKMGIKILAMAPSNLGVDNLVERLSNVGLRVVRLGHPARTTQATQRHTLDALLHGRADCSSNKRILKHIFAIQDEMRRMDKSDKEKAYKELCDLREKLRERREKETKYLIRDADVVLCTLLSAHSKGALRYTRADHFGLTVIDECSQGTEASCYLGILRSPKLILAGDHKQLPPTVLHPEASPLLTSLMERVVDLYGDRVTRLLTVQYRMNRSIMDWASDAMYEGQLIAHDSVKNHLLCDMDAVVKNEITTTPILLIDTCNAPGCDEQESHCSQLTNVSSSKCNEGEAKLVLSLVKKLIIAGLKHEEVAVITPYSGQVKMVGSILSTNFPGVEVQTVDGFQGREKEAVILSLVRSNEKGEIGFLAEERRLNVAVTRAKRHLSVICNTATLQQNEFINNFVTYLTENGTVIQAEDFKDNCLMDPADKAPFDQIAEETKPNNQTTEEQNPAIREKVKSISNFLKDFIESSYRRYRFSSNLSNIDRMLVRDLAEDLHLEHYTVGEGSLRRIIVVKRNNYESQGPSRYSKEFGNCWSRYSSSSSHKFSSSQKHGKNLHLLEDQKYPSHCSICSKNTVYCDRSSHRLACKENEVELNYELKARKRKAALQISDSKCKRRCFREQYKEAAAKRIRPYDEGYKFCHYKRCRRSLQDKIDMKENVYKKNTRQSKK